MRASRGACPKLLPAPPHGRPCVQAVKLVIKVLSKTMDSTTLSPEKVELSTLSRDEASSRMVYKVIPA